MTVSTRQEQDAIHFHPSRVEGVADVDQVRVWRDRLELRSGGRWVAFRFASIAPGREIASGLAPVGELHFSKAHYPDSHFVFYTSPRVVIYMPVDGPTRSPQSHFFRVLQVLREGGFRVYDEGQAAREPAVLDARPGRTVGFVVAVMAFAWLWGLSGFLPGPAGEGVRHFMLSNPRNPSIGLAFMLPATAVPILLAFRHGSNRRRRVAIMAGSFALALASEWALREAIRPWAPLEGPPFYKVFGSVRRVVSLGVVVTVATLVAASWRGGFLEPISEAEREGGGVTG